MRIHRLLIIGLLASACKGSSGRTQVSPIDAPPASVKTSAGLDQPWVCVVLDGVLQQVQPLVEDSSGDTLVMGLPLRRSYGGGASPYAAEQEWAVRHQPIIMGRQTLYENGLPRVFSPTDLRKYGEYRGIPVFVDAAAPIKMENPPVIYTLESPDCMFQPYHFSGNTRP